MNSMSDNMEKVAFLTNTENMNMFMLKQVHEQKEKELIAANKKLIAIIGHDIKSPMSLIISYLNLLKDGVHKLDKIKIEEKVDIALNATQKTYSLADNLLEWAYAERFGNSFQPESIDFNRLLIEVTENIKAFASYKQIEIRTLIFSEFRVYADENMVKTIIRNLLNNAIKYSYKSGEIEIRAKSTKGFLEISVKDFGTGIKNTDVIFNPNNYISTLGTENESGTGFGLLLCKEFVEIQQGKIWAISNTGHGSEFKFTLPLSQE